MMFRDLTKDEVTLRWVCMPDVTQAETYLAETFQGEALKRAISTVDHALERIKSAKDNRHWPWCCICTIAIWDKFNVQVRRGPLTFDNEQQFLDSNHRTELEDEAMLLLNQQVRDMARLLLERVE